MFADTRETETVFGPVIQAGLEALKVGKCIVIANFQSEYSEVHVPSFSTWPIKVHVPPVLCSQLSLLYIIF